MPQHMELEKLYKMLHEEDEKKYALAEEGGLDVGDMNFNPIMTLNIKAKNFLSELLIIADKDFMDKINELVREICQNVRAYCSSLLPSILIGILTLNNFIDTSRH